MAQQRRKFSPQFQAEAVRRLLETGLSVAEDQSLSKVNPVLLCGCWWSAQHLTIERLRRWGRGDASGILIGRSGTGS